MLFDNAMNKELQSFSRNIASQLLIGGIGLLSLYRADTKPDLLWYEFSGLYSRSFIADLVNVFSCK